MDPDDGLNEDGPFTPWLPPDDRLWRHPSEMADVAVHRSGPVAIANRGAGRVWTVALVAGVIGALVASGIGAATGEFAHTTSVVRPIQYVIQSSNAEPASSLTQPNWPSIYNTLSPSLVTIAANGDNGEVTAAGVLWQSQGRDAFILTDEHAVDGTGSVQVTFTGGGAPLAGRVVGSDNLAGIAVIEVTNIGRPLAGLGRVANLQIGQSVAAIGPEGPTMGGSLTAGTVSGLDREVHVSDGPTMLGMIGVNSSGAAPAGAALVEANGAVVALTTSVQSTDPIAAGVTFAVPIDVAIQVADQLVGGHLASHPWLGVVEADNLLPAYANQFGVSGGADVDSVMAASPAANVGIRPGDVITSLNGAPVTSAASLMLATSACRPYHPVAISYLRGRTTARVTIIPDEQPSDVSP